MSVNKVIVLGRLGKDPELKYTPAGQPVCSFSIACSESWTDKSGQKQEKTEWINVVVWGKLAELCNQYLAKGRQAFIEGKLSTRSWDDKDGKKCYKTEVVAETVQFLGGNAQGKDQAQGQDNQQAKGKKDDHSEHAHESDASFAADDIPF